MYNPWSTSSTPASRGRPEVLFSVCSFASLCAMAACPNAAGCFRYFSLEWSVCGGSQFIGHAISARITASPECVKGQLDWRNSYDSLSLEAMLAAIIKCQPTLLPFAAWTYKRPGRLLDDGGPASTAPIVLQCGECQGDPCGALCFLLTHLGKHEDFAPGSASVCIH